MKWSVSWFLVFLTGIVSISSAKATISKNVLIVDTVGSPSHQVWMHSLGRAVAEHGYNTTILTYTLVKDSPLNLHVYHVDNLYNLDIGEEYNVLDFSQMGPWETFFMYTGWYEFMDTLGMDSAALKNILNYPPEFQFDLIIFDYLSPISYLVLADRFPNARLIGASPYPAIESTNRFNKGPLFPSFEPHFFMSEIKDSFFSRLESFLMYSAAEFMDKYKFIPQSEKIVRQHYNLSRPLTEIADTMTILLANHHPVLDIITPILPNVIPIGGLQIEDPKPLNTELEEVFASAKKGVILFALGSNVKSELLGLERLQIIIDVLSQFPEYNFVWKIDLAKLNLKMPSNVFIKSWLPQNDILADKRTKLFISHAGGLSTQEATWYGKPMLAIPIMFDQKMNAERAVRSGMALQVDIHNLKKEELLHSLTELLNNKTFAEAAQLRSRNFQDQKEKPLERALWWIDFIARNPDVSFMKNSKLKDMNFIVKQSIDVIAFLSFVVLAMIIIFVKILCCLICSTKKSQTKLKKN